MHPNNYYELVIPAPTEELRAVLIAQLAELGYDGFEESDETLKAYIPEPDFEQLIIDNLFNQYDLKYSKSTINKQNWNAVWESNFDPVQVDDFVGVRAAFHPSFKGVAHEIVITPKMSFGTGHHATTYLVMQLMRDLDFTGKSVFDFGTGTGILAILAEKLGATYVRAVDNDDWCIENALENISINHSQSIDIDKVDTAINDRKFEIIIANINRNIILDNKELIAGSIEQGGELILSGLLTHDEKDIFDACTELGLTHIVTREKNGWIAMRFFMK